MPGVWDAPPLSLGSGASRSPYSSARADSYSAGEFVREHAAEPLLEGRKTTLRAVRPTYSAEGQTIAAVPSTRQ
jgi:hypothetical protein